MKPLPRCGGLGKELHLSSASSTVKLDYEDRATHHTGLLQGSYAETHESAMIQRRAIQV